MALRLGFRQVKGLTSDAAEALVARRGNGYADPLVLWRRAAMKGRALETLARADAFRSMGLDRREALWAVKGLAEPPLPLFAAAGEEERGPEPAVALPVMALSEHVVDDYASLRLSLKAHPVAFLRARLAGEGMIPTSRLQALTDGRAVKVAGLVLVRQRPGSAKGVIFATLEDETGVANVVVWPDIFQRYRRVVLKASLLGVHGRLQREGLVIHVVAARLLDLSPRLASLQNQPRTTPVALLEPPLARADEVKRPSADQRQPAGLEKALFPSRDFH